MHGFLLAVYLLRTWLSKTAVTYTTEKRLCSLAGSNCSFISFILAIIAKAVSFAFMSAPNLFNSVSFRTFSDPLWSRQGINFWIIRFSFTRKSSEKLKTGSWKSLPTDLLLPTSLLWFCLFPPLPSSSPWCLPLSGGVIYVLGCPGVFPFLCIFEVSLNLGISSNIFSAYSFLYLLICFRCLCRSPITPYLSHCSFWDFLTHINTPYPIEKAVAIYIYLA